MSKQIKFGSPRVVLLVEIERYCQLPDCMKLNRIGLTKAEALTYTGYTCERCGQWNDDELSEKDVPDWWEELKTADLSDSLETK